VQKPFSPARLKQLVLRAVEADERRRSGDLHAQQVSAQLESLSEEERATLDLLLEGRLNKHIAATLDVSRRTVQYRIAGLLEKFGVDSRNQLISLISSASASMRD
jgi:FixJ family two-component response regulator